MMPSKSKVIVDLRGPGWLSSHSNGEACVLGRTVISGYVEVAIDDLQNDDSKSSRALYNIKQRESEFQFFTHNLKIRTSHCTLNLLTPQIH
jgi:hypothetical protein